MNAMWRREAIPLSYHMLMGQAFLDLTNPDINKLPFDRFGDIWCGIIQKKICDHLRWSVSSGTPYIHHDRASNPFTNLRKEANGIEVNEWFWEKVDAINFGNTKMTAASLYKEVGRNIRNWDGEHKDYWRRLGDAMVIWADLF
jgi:reversibly glycosylated polypeptide/UDP-arabinopyranose mutase